MSDFNVVLPTTKTEWQRDMNIAYEQGRADAIEECMRAIVNTESKVVNPCASLNWDELKLLANRQSEILEILKQLKEKKQND